MKHKNISSAKKLIHFLFFADYHRGNTRSESKYKELAEKWISINSSKIKTVGKNNEICPRCGINDYYTTGTVKTCICCQYKY